MQPSLMPLIRSRVSGRVVLGHGEVVEEQQRLAAGAEAIVDRHGDEVDADGVVLAHQRGDLELAADAVGAGDQHGVAVVAGEEAGVVVEAEEAGEAAEAVEDARRVRAAEEGRHAGQALLVDVEIQAGGTVGQFVRRRLVHRRQLPVHAVGAKRHLTAGWSRASTGGRGWAFVARLPGRTTCHPRAGIDHLSCVAARLPTGLVRGHVVWRRRWPTKHGQPEYATLPWARDDIACLFLAAWWHGPSCRGLAASVMGSDCEGPDEGQQWTGAIPPCRSVPSNMLTLLRG